MVIDPTKRYPLISNVYPGPQTDLVPRAFALDDNGNQSLANMGCYVLNVAARGSSPFRGRDFYCYSVGQLRDYPLADDKTAIEQVAKSHPVDLDRIGIYGHSGGGFQAMTAMCTYPDFYKVGFAASGNHDNNIYINWWGEVFHGSPKIPTTIELAPRLQGKLMLTVGGMDNNVPPASTYRLAQALIKAGKPFEFFLFPDARHDLESPYYTGLLRRFFGEHLLRLSSEDLQKITYK
jgi:peptidase